MLHLVQQRGWSDRFQIDSAGTASYHIGELPGRARQFVYADFERFDHVLAVGIGALRLCSTSASPPAQDCWSTCPSENPPQDPARGSDDRVAGQSTHLAAAHNLVDQLAIRGLAGRESGPGVASQDGTIMRTDRSGYQAAHSASQQRGLQNQHVVILLRWFRWLG